MHGKHNMNRINIDIVKAGAYTLIQDLGRAHVQHLGFSGSGAIDEHAFLWANKLLNNPMNTPMLEITLGQVQIKFSQECVIALTGADCNAFKQLDSPHMPGHLSTPKQRVANWTSTVINKDEILTLQLPQQGLRSYLAFAGEMQLKPCHNAYATNPGESIGGLNGKPLQSGCQLSVNAFEQPSRCFNVPKAYQSDYPAMATLQYLPSLLLQKQEQNISAGFHQQHYDIDPASNRMGYRLKGKPVKIESNNVISRPTCFGAIQLPADGQPIVLMKDAQTIGGYPVIGSLSRQSAWQLAQMRPGQKVRFQPVSLEHASVQTKLMYQFFFAEASGQVRIDSTT